MDALDKSKPQIPKKRGKINYPIQTKNPKPPRNRENKCFKQLHSYNMFFDIEMEAVSW